MRPLRTLLRYLLAVILTAIAVMVRKLVDPVMGDHVPHAPFYAAVAGSAAAVGWGPGILAVVLGAMASAYFIVPPRGSFFIQGSEHQLGFALYVGVSAILVAMGGCRLWMRRISTALRWRRF